MKGEIVRVVMYSCLVIDSEYVFWGITCSYRNLMNYRKTLKNLDCKSRTKLCIRMQ